jgi:hypothetical protein
MNALARLRKPTALYLFQQAVCLCEVLEQLIICSDNKHLRYTTPTPHTPRVTSRAPAGRRSALQSFQNYCSYSVAVEQTLRE